MTAMSFLEETKRNLIYEALENAKRIEGADSIDDNIIEGDNVGNYSDTCHCSDSDDQEELQQSVSVQRPDQAEGRPALDVSEAAAIRQAATEPQVRRRNAEEEALDNAFGNSGAFVPPVPEFVQEAHSTGIEEWSEQWPWPSTWYFQTGIPPMRASQK